MSRLNRDVYPYDPIRKRIIFLYRIPQDNEQGNMDCHTSTMEANGADGSVALIGHPNVGKSAIFQRLTGQRVMISNYPGTTVTVSRGRMLAFPDIDLVDTPGLITIPTHTEDEHVTTRVLLEETPRVLLQVGDAKNIRRTLLLTLQLAEMGLPFVLALNMTDEAQKAGLDVDAALIAKKLGIQVIQTAAVHDIGLTELSGAIATAQSSEFNIEYPAVIEQAVGQLLPFLPDGPITQRSQALLWLSDDEVYTSWLRKKADPETLDQMLQFKTAAASIATGPPAALIQQSRLALAATLTAESAHESKKKDFQFGSVLGRIAMHRVWGWGILGLILYTIYWFVGVFGAGTLVDALESRLFGEIINPWITNLVSTLIPVPLVVEFLVGKYGLWTIGVTYALALILPIVTTFFLSFGLLEDSGYLPRLVALSNRVFQALGLNGKAVLPMVLGLGCVTMATVTTRVLETKRDRFLVTLMLALAVPCSAQLGVVMGLLAGISFTATLIWSGVVALVLLLVGWLAARFVSGDRTPLLIELPPMRLPQFRNVVLKTVARLEWYLKEVIPFFLIGAAVMFALDLFGVLDWLAKVMEPLVVHWLGLPAEASAAFLMGFLRRDFGATGLFVMEAQGLLSPMQVVVSMVTITLFIPCVASVLIIAKEHGRRTATGMVLLIFPLAFLVAGVLYRFLAWIGWML